MDVIEEYCELASAGELIGRRARYADLTLIGPEVLATQVLKAKIIDGSLFHAGRPILLVPQGAKATLAPERVMVAWDSRVESSRAIRESLDLLVAAKAVELVLVDPVPDEGGHGAEPGADAGAYLARHGVRVDVARLPTEGLVTASVLKRHAVDFAADLMVMGAYGHSRLRERMFGGVTKSMIEEPPVAVLMAH
jgi:nucleotide-binding universal stress UspA family protein